MTKKVPFDSWERPKGDELSLVKKVEVIPPENTGEQQTTAGQGNKKAWIPRG